MPRGKFYAPQTSQNARPMTFEKDRKIENWDKSEAETQSLERARKQKTHMRSDPDDDMRHG